MTALAVPAAELGSTGAQRLVDGLGTAVLLFDETPALRYLNQAAEILLSVSRRTALGRSLEEMLPDPGRLPEVLRRGLREGRGYLEFGLELGTRRGGTQLLDARISPTAEENPDGVVLELTSSRDRRRQREEQLLNLHGASRDLVRGLAHEVKNPLGAILGAAQLLEDEPLGREGRECLHIIRKETERLRDLVDRMLRGDAPLHRTRINVHELLEYVCELVELEGMPGVRIVREYDPSLPEFHADRNGLVQALLNLLRNALQAVGEQGVVRLRTTPLRRHLLGGRLHRRVARIDITDNGPGLPEELRERAFYPLVSGYRGGSGLGLPLAQDVLRAHGGEILYERCGAETVFSLLIPMEEGDKPGTAGARARG